MKLNKILSLGAVLACGLTLASCGEKTPSTDPSTNPSTPATTTAQVNLGLGYAGEFVWNEATAYAPAMGQLDLSVATAAFDADGKIVDARIDVVQVKVLPGDNNTGLKLYNTNLDSDNSVTTKLELGKDYNMKGSSAIGAEVDAQIEAFADWTVGQTVAEVKANVAENHGYGTAPHADLAASCTIVVHDFVAALEKAYEMKTTATYDATGIKAGVAMMSGLAFNYGNPQTDISVDIAGTIVANGKVVAAQVDAVVVPTVTNSDGTVAFKTEGNKYLVDGKIASKKTLGDAYAMVGAPSTVEGEVCTLEWYEQAAIMEAAAAGKTPAEIATLTANTGDLTGATITLGSYVKAMAKAATYAETAVIGPQA